MEMEITFETGFSNLGNKILQKDQKELSAWEKYKEKKKEKKKERKMEKK